jgi:hypothetical protein
LRVRTDDEIYRIDAVWLGPPRATFPWRATYASYLLGFLIFILVLFVQRRIGISFNIFPTAWALVITVFLTRVVSRKVNYEKGVVHLFEHFWYEVTGPRERTDRRRIALRDSRVRVRREPAPRNRAGRVEGARRGSTGSSRSRPASSGGSGGSGARADTPTARPRKRSSRAPRPHPLRNGGR